MSATPPPALNLTVIRSADLERARGFYAAMGLLMSRDSHGSGPEHYVSVVEGLVFEIYPLAPNQTPTIGTRLGFRVDSVDDLVPLLVRAGGTLTVAPKDIDGARYALVTDPDGHRVELITATDGHLPGTHDGD